MEIVKCFQCYQSFQQHSAALPEYFQDLLGGLPLLTEGQVELLPGGLQPTTPGGHLIHLLVQEGVLLPQLLTATPLIGQILLKESQSIRSNQKQSYSRAS